MPEPESTVATSAPGPALFVFDVDGTLLDSSLRITPGTRRAVRELLEGGHRVALASARPPKSIAQLSRDLLGQVAEMIALNGALVAEGDTVLRESAIDAADVAAVIEHARSRDLEINLFSGWDWLVERLGPGVEAETKIVDFRPEVVDDLLAGGERAVHKILLIGDPVSVREVRDWAGTGDRAVAASLSKPHYCELVSRNVSKAGAMAFLAHRLGFADERVVAFGDGDNDLPMIRTAGVGVAMGNAMDEVKRAAQLTTRGHDEEGIAHALHRLGYVRAPDEA